MSRIATAGMELGRDGGVRTEGSDGLWHPGTDPTTNQISPVSTGGFTYSTTTGVHIDGRAAICPSSGTAYLTVSTGAPGLATGRRYYVCFYFSKSANPAAAIAIWRLWANAGTRFQIRLETDGTLTVRDNVGQIGSASSALTNNQMYRVEFDFVVPASGTSTCNAEVYAGTNADDTTPMSTMCSGTSMNAGNSMATPGMDIGLVGSNVGITATVDDYAVNDDQGSVNNGRVGPHHIKVLPAVADISVGGNWKRGGGTATGLFNAVDNIPPVGVAANGTDSSQIIDAVSETASYTAECQDYSAAGIGDSSPAVVMGIMRIGTSSVTQTNPGAARLLSNPDAGADATIDFEGGGAAAGTDAESSGAGWHTAYISPQENPTVTLGTRPQVRITKNTATTRVHMASLMGVMVDYDPTVSGSSPAAITPASGGVVFGGSNFVKTPAVVTPASGGVVFGGSNSVVTKAIVTPATGGAVFGGSATVSTPQPLAPASGGVVFGGSATVLAPAVIAPASGGVVFGGSNSVITPAKVIPASGGVVFGGSNLVIVPGPAPIVPASGGVLFGGSNSVITPAKVMPASGGVVFSGSALVKTTQPITPASGGVLFGGSATVVVPSPQPVAPASGGVLFGGTVSAKTSAVVAPASGGAVFGGSAVVAAPTPALIYPASGGIRFGAGATVHAALNVPLATTRLRRFLPSRHGARLEVGEAESGFAAFQQSSSGQPQAAADASGIGTIAWTSPTNAETADGNGALASLGSITTHPPTSSSQGNNAAGQVTDYHDQPVWWGVTSGYSFQSALANTSSGQVFANLNGTSYSDTLQLDTFGFGIPSNATITGIQVQVNGSSGGVRDSTIQVYSYDAGAGGTNKSINSNLPSGGSTRTYGGPGDTHGRSWTPAEINSSGFVLFLQYHNDGGLSHLVTLEWAAITIFYTTPNPDTYNIEGSHYLKLTNPNVPTIDPTATITGIKVDLIRRDASGGPPSSGGGGVWDREVKIIKGGTVQTQNKADSGPFWPASYAQKSYGGAGDLWGVSSWAPADIGSGFGVAVAVYGGGSSALDGIADIDYALFTVYFTLPGSTVTIQGAAPMVFSPEEPLPERVMLECEYDTEMPGGYGAATIVIPHPEFFDPSDYLYALTTIYEYETAATEHLGRCVGVSDDGKQVGLEIEGRIKMAEDDHTLAFLGIDRDFNSWTGPTVDDIVFNASAGWVIDEGSVSQGDTGGGETALKQTIEAPWDSQANKGRKQAVNYYRAKGGQKIGALDYCWEQDGNIPADGSLVNFERYLLTNNWASSNGGSITAAGPGSGTLNATTGDRDSAELDLYGPNSNSATAGIVDGRVFNVFWTLLGVIGNHGLPVSGTLATPNTGRTLNVADIINYIMTTWVPNLPIETIEPSSVGLSDIKFGLDTPITAREAIEGLVIYGGNSGFPLDFGCYAQGFFAASPGTYGNTWRTRYDEGAEASASGPDVQRMINGIMIRYDPSGSGEQYTVGPPGSGANFETSQLIDVSDSNPANRDGQRHWELFEAGIMPEALAVLVGEVVLMERNRQEWRGDVTIKDHVRDDAGNWWPVGFVHSGDDIIVEDDLDTRPRRIVNTSGGGTASQVQCSIGAQPDKLDVFLARAGVRFVGVLS